MTIVEACRNALRETGKAMTTVELLDHLTRNRLYAFKAKDPLSVLRSTLRKYIRIHPSPAIVESTKGVYKALK